MSARHIAIGDIHGCAAELEKLLEKLSPAASDRLVFLGDLLNKGPDSTRVLDIVRATGGLCIMGNHELRLREYRRTRNITHIKKEDIPTLARMRPQDWDLLDAMVPTHYVAELDTIFVHGGFLPRIAWREQPLEVITRIQVVDRQGRPRKRSECDNGIPWADLWTGPSFVVYGHTPRPEVYETLHSMGIDTGCVLGGKLTALILPEKRLVQVRARQAYCGD